MICQIIDSSGGLPRPFMQQHGIIEVPFYFKFGKTDYRRENVDCSLAEFYQHMEQYPDDIPQTSAPNINDWLTVFEEQHARGAKRYIVTTISSKLSSSFQNAVLAKNTFTEKNPDAQVEVIDSNTCACGQAALEIAVAKMIDSGREFQEIINTIHQIATTINTLFVVNHLKYMQAGGRIGGAAAFVGKLVQIKPVCEFVDGVVRPSKAVIGRKNSLKTMIDIAASRISNWNRVIVTLQNAGFQADADYAIDYFRKVTGFSGTIHQSELGIIVGAHSGPGAAGIGLIEDPLG
ncbi:DegV family protein [Faecalispora anaeroviscerum]|uniref:DegV family protein n=1 Tax=Faecalispora anaeroviscerum TaxID=2991836 RepID=UPI0024BB885A|nr:DegV family protein [Faecalispora anaeroviscerum]